MHSILGTVLYHQINLNMEILSLIFRIKTDSAEMFFQQLWNYRLPPPSTQTHSTAWNNRYNINHIWNFARFPPWVSRECWTKLPWRNKASLTPTDASECVRDHPFQPFEERRNVWEWIRTVLSELHFTVPQNKLAMLMLCNPQTLVTLMQVELSPPPPFFCYSYLQIFRFGVSLSIK